MDGGLAGRSPSYTSLSLTFREDWIEDDDEMNDELFSTLPSSLTSFSLNPPSAPDDMDEGYAIQLPHDFLNRLTDFSFACDWNALKLLKVLKSCSNLETLILDFKSTTHVWGDGEPVLSGREPHDDQRIVSPKLRTLRFRRLLDEAFFNIAPYLTAPVLSELDISFAEDLHTFKWDTRDPVFHGQLVDFLSRKSADHEGLRHLRLHAAKMSGSDWLSICDKAKLHYLTHLTLDDFNVVDPNVLFERHESLPKLTTLEVLNADHGYPVDSLKGFAKAKPRGGNGVDASHRNLIITHRP